MRHARIMISLALSVMMAACGDAPTAPEVWAGEVSRSGDYLLPPVVVVGTPQCDPYTDLSWCQEDGDGGGGGSCMTGASGEEIEPEYLILNGCPGIGTGPGGGKPGGGGITGPGGETLPEEPVPTDTCKTSEVMVNDPDVHGQFDNLWNQSLTQGVEQGGWIVQDGPGDYRLIPFQNAVSTPCGVDIFEAPPSNLISIFHTHPWTLGQARMCNGTYALYTGTPSPDDTHALQQLGLSAGYFIDHGGIGKYTLTGGQTATRIGRCGY